MPDDVTATLSTKRRRGSRRTPEERRRHAEEVAESREREKLDIRYFYVPLKKTNAIQALKDAGIKLSEADETNYHLLGRLMGNLLILPLTFKNAAELLIKSGRLDPRHRTDEALILEALSSAIDEVLPGFVMTHSINSRDPG